VDSLGQPSRDDLFVTFITDKGHFRFEGHKYMDGKTSGGAGTVRVPFTSDKDVIGTARIIAKAEGMTQTLQIALTAPPSQQSMPHASTVRPKASPETLGNLVLRLQMALSLKGYQPGPLDGVLGAQTRAALQTFQRDQGIPVTGRMETATLDALGIKLP
jgi:His-Xaa-Ser repeat protein HxsA